MSHAATNYTFRLRLKPTIKLIALAFADCANPDGTSIRPSIPRVVEDSCTSEQTVRRAVKFLVQQRLLVVVRPSAQHRAIEYRMPMDEAHPLFQPRDGFQGSQFGTSDGKTEENANESVSSLFRVANLAPLSETARPAKNEVRGTKNTSRGATAMAPDPSLDLSLDPLKGENAAAPRLAHVADLVGLWNAVREPGPKVTQITPQRKSAYDKALEQNREHADWSMAIEWLNRQAYANAPGTGEHSTWRATLDWLAKPGQLAKVLEQARTDATAPRRANRHDPPTYHLTDADKAAGVERRRQLAAFQAQQEALNAQAADLVLGMSDKARAILEREALAALDQCRERLGAARFDELVCNRLPHELVKIAADRPLVDVVAELEARVAA